MKTMAPLRLEFDPSFVEEAVFLEMTREGANGSRGRANLFCRERDQIYEEEKTREKRDERFRSFYRKWFEGVGLEAFFRDILFDFHLILQTQPLIFMKRVWAEKGEGAELYGEGGEKTVLIRLRVVRLNEKDLLKAFLRQELTHISDILDPAFQYSPHLGLNGENEVEEDLMRERFCFLWNVYIEKRMRAKDWHTLIPTEIRRRQFEMLFSLWDPRDQKRIFQRIMAASEPPLTQQELLDLAKAKGWRCPLCQFPSRGGVTMGDGEVEWLETEIRRDYPAWEPRKGICPQCFELYRARMRLDGVR